MLANRRPRALLAWLLLVLASAAWLWFQPYQSHYVSGLRLLGDTGTVALIGEPKEGRGDEWSTYLPMLKQAHGEGFPARSHLEPYRERFDWFIALPHADASLLLLPNQLAFWAMPPGLALSFQGLYYNLLLLLSVFWLLRNLKVAPGLAAAAGLVLLFSHLYQAWWTSNFPCLGASLLPFAVLTSGLRWRWRGPLLGWSIAHMLFGQLYPPFQVALAIAVLPFVAAARPDLLRWRTLAWAMGWVAAGCAVVAWLRLPYVEAVAGTSYPGARSSSGGGVTAGTLLSVLFPTWPATPPANIGAAFYEMSMAASFFPLLAIAALPVVAWTREVRRVAIVSLLVGVVLAVYMLWGFPEPIAKATGFSLVPGVRMQLGFSVLGLLLSVYLVSRTRAPIPAAWLLAAFGTYALVSWRVGLPSFMEGQLRGLDAYPWLGLALLCVAGGAALLAGRGRDAGRAMTIVLVGGMTVAHVLVFGSFNPVMRGSDIMRPVDTQLVRDWKALYHMNHERPFAVPGSYGQLLRGEGLAALGAVHLANVDESTYARVFPEVDARARHAFFNQFLGISFDNVPHYRKIGVAATFPVRLHSIPFPHSVESMQLNVLSLNDPIEVGSVVRESPSRYKVYWNGTLLRSLPITSSLALHSPCRLEASWMTRYPTAGALVAGGGTSLRGIAGEFEVAARSETEASACARAMVVSTTGAAGAVATASPIEGGAGLRAGSSWSRKPCDLEIAPEQAVQRGRALLLRGFVVAPSDRSPGDFDIVLAGPARAYRFAATTGVARPDVATSLHNPRLGMSGFRAGIAFTGVEAGRYAVEFHGTEGGRGWFCESGKTLVVPPASSQ